MGISDILQLVAKNSALIGIFLFFQGENSFTTIHSINFITFFLILISFLLKNQLSRACSAEMLNPEMILRIIMTVIVTLLNQTFFVFNIITFTFLVHDLADHIFTVAEYYYKKYHDQDLSMIPNYKNVIILLNFFGVQIIFFIYFNDYGLFSKKEIVVQVVLAFAVFVKEVGSQQLLMAFLLAFLEIATKVSRNQMLQLPLLDSKAFDSITMIICFAVHLIVIVVKRMYNDSEIAYTGGSQFQSMNHFMVFIVLMVACTYFANESLKGKLDLQKRNRYQSAILWILLVINHLAFEQKDMGWNSQSLILIYGILAICELANMESPQISYLIISSDQSVSPVVNNVILSSSNMQGIESYDQASLANFLKHIKRNQDSKKLILMLAFSFSFMFIELIYGMLSNSLSLISDSAHMLFDSSALAIGLYAAFMSKLRPSPTYSYGFERFSTLSGFMNGLFLIFVAFDIFTESIERIYEPQEVLSEKMMVVSVIGLIINLVGLCFFHEHAHVHGEEDEGGCSHSHSKKIEPESSTYQKIQIHDSSSQKDKKEHINDLHESSHGEHHHGPNCNHTHEKSNKSNKNNDHDHDHDHKHDHCHDHKHEHTHEHSSCSSHKHGSCSDHTKESDTQSHRKEPCDHQEDHHHHHDHEHEHEHGSSCNHDHSKKSHDSSKKADNDSGYNENLTGVYLHILADALGSVGVIISSVLIYKYGWFISDPITSFIISIFIFVSVFPLLKQSLATLLQGYNVKKHESRLVEIVQQITSHSCVESISDVHLWAYISSALVFTVKVQIKDARKKFKVLKDIKKILLKHPQIKYQTIEIVSNIQVELVEVQHADSIQSDVSLSTYIQSTDNQSLISSSTLKQEEQADEFEFSPEEVKLI